MRRLHGPSTVQRAVSKLVACYSNYFYCLSSFPDARTYRGYRLYQGSCSHCHGPDGMGSTFAASLVDHLPSVDAFRRIVNGGQSSCASVMKGFADDPNIAPYIDDIYAYLQARADGALGRGRPIKSAP